MSEGLVGLSCDHGTRRRAPLSVGAVRFKELQQVRRDIPARSVDFRERREHGETGTSALSVYAPHAKSLSPRTDPGFARFLVPEVPRLSAALKDHPASEGSAPSQDVVHVASRQERTLHLVRVPYSLVAT